jgi:hypothetical protein
VVFGRAESPLRRAFAIALVVAGVPIAIVLYALIA